jgi:hypothetical protein
MLVSGSGWRDLYWSDLCWRDLGFRNLSWCEGEDWPRKVVGWEKEIDVC